MARVSKSVQEIRKILDGRDSISSFVVNKYVAYRNNQMQWRSDLKELRNYIFQTDTTQTSNSKLPWKNKTSIPKICQIRDNLHANYMAALFPHDDWFKWEAESQDALDRETARAIESYIKQKIRESNFKDTISDLVLDYIDTGNSFAEVVYDLEQHEIKDGPAFISYIGPRVQRISPYDIVFDLSATSFREAPKMTRTLVSVGSLQHAAETIPGYEWAAEAVTKSKHLRMELALFGDSDLDKAEGIDIDGFGSLRQFIDSGMVELLEYEGDTFDVEAGELKTNRRIIVVDRRFVVLDEPIDSWLGRTNKEHVGWRKRPDNLWGMSPLANLVGMQYRLDHLENLKADVFDQIAHPVIVVRGVVEDFEWGPDERIYADVDSDVAVLRPDSTALNANFEMDILMRNMEDMAGAPRQAMGIRTPGEKTAFEVQALENNAGRIFQQKIQQFEEQLIEPILNQMLAAARKHVTSIELVKIQEEDFGLQAFLSISPETLAAKGKLRPIGARHFARQAQITQNLMGFINSGAYQDPSINTHVSGKRIAELFEEALGLGKFDIVQDNIRIAEQQQTQSLATQAQQSMQEELGNRQMAIEQETVDVEQAIVEGVE